MSTSRNSNEYNVLRLMILRGEVLPSERLIEADFAKRLGTNRANIRRALTRLSEDGLVVIEPRRGTHVRRISEKEAVEIFEVRGALEAMLLPYAVRNLKEDDKSKLRELAACVTRAQAAQDALAVGRASREVREELWRIAGHSTGQRLLKKMNSQLVRINFQAILLPGRAAAIASDVERLIDAVCAGAMERAMKQLKAYQRSANDALALAIAQRSVYSF